MSPAHSAPARPRVSPARRLHIVLAVMVSALALAGAVVAVRATAGAPGDPAATASSAALGHAASEAVAPGGRGWRSSGETTGAWLDLAWSRAREVSSLTIVRPSLDQPGVTDGIVDFSDGSSLQVRLSTTSPTTTVPFPARSVAGARLTVAGVAPGTDAAEIDQLTLGTADGADSAAGAPPPDGNVAPRARVTADPAAGGSDPAALVDGSGAAGAAGAGAAWTATRPRGASVDLRWDAPQELTSLEVVGGGGDTSLASATLTFSDGATLPLGGVPTDPARPTILSFRPRMATAVRLTVDDVSGSGALTLAELRAYRAGFTPVRAATGPAPPGVVGPRPAPACPASSGPRPATLTVRCPTGDALVGAGATVRAAVPSGYTSVRAEVWPADLAVPAGRPVFAVPDPAGEAVLPLDLTDVAPGPFTVAVVATGSRADPQTVFLSLYRAGPRDGAPRPPSAAARGRTLVYDDEFSSPVSLTRTGAGADYAASQPSPQGGRDFGEAPFADPAAGLGTVGTTDGLLRLGLEPEGSGLAGAMLSSARAGGSGFAAQYGYFEARIFTPVAPGTWPAFWTLPADDLVTKQPVRAEIDALERYGRFPRGTCQSTHAYQGEQDTPVNDCDTGRFATEREGLGWHVYGVAVGPGGNVFTIDGQVVSTLPQIPGADAPMFFMLDLAAGGGWPVDLSGLGGHTAMYVDDVRVYV